MGCEPGTVIEKNTGHFSVSFDNTMKPVQEEACVFRRTDNCTKHHAGSIIDKEKGNPFYAVYTCPKVFSVTQHHVHPMWVSKATAIAQLFRIFALPGVETQPLHTSPYSCSVDMGVDGDNFELSGAPDQFRDRCEGIILFLFFDKIK